VSHIECAKCRGRISGRLTFRLLSALALVLLRRDAMSLRGLGIRMMPSCVLALGTLSCGGAGAETSSVSGCEQQLNGGASIPQCTCAAMTASPPSSNSQSMVQLVASTTSDKLDPNYDVGLPAGTQICFVAMDGQVTVPSPPGSSATMTYPYSFAIFTESPWTLTEGGATPTQPTLGAR
jgi:hypothetical protein